MTWWFTLLLVLVASCPSVLLTILLWRYLLASTRTQQATTALLERAINALSAKDVDEFLRMQRSSSTSLLYSPSEPEEPAEEPKPDAYQEAIDLGVPDDVAQFIEE